VVGPTAIISRITDLDIAGAFAFVITWSIEIKGAIGS